MGVVQPSGAGSNGGQPAIVSSRAEAAVSDLLGSKLLEWASELENALVELRLAGVPNALDDEPALSEAVAQSASAPIGSKLVELWTEVDRTRDELRSLCEAEPLLQQLAAQLDAEGRQALHRAIDLLSTVDFATRLDVLAAEVRHLRELRMARMVN